MQIPKERAGKTPRQQARYERVIRETWEKHRERNYQRTRPSGETFKFTTMGDLLLVVGKAQYGPVKGNRKSDHERKVKRIAELLGGVGGLMPNSFIRNEVFEQS